MTCEGCSGAINRILGRLKDKGQVSDFKVDLETKKVFVTTSNLSKEEVIEAVKKAGKETTFVGET